MDPSAHIQKFFFLAVLVVVVILAKQGDAPATPPKEAARTAALLGLQKKSLAVNRAEPQPFVLEPLGEGGAGETDGGRKADLDMRPITATPPVVLENIPPAQRKSSIPQQGGDVSSPKVGAASAIIADLFPANSTGLVLAGQDPLLENSVAGKTYFEFFADRMWPMASITKLVSASVVSGEINMLSEVELIQGDFWPAGAENGLKPGGLYSARDLLLAMLLKSSNESAEALARIYPGGRTAFVARMNTLIKEWGLRDTNFDDPTGLSPANESTVKDLAKLAKHIYEEHPEIFEITRRKEAGITELKSGRTSTVANINLFAGWKEFVGGKTGYTDEAGGNLLTVFSTPSTDSGHGDRGPIVIVVLGSPDRFGETEFLWNWFKSNFR